MSEARLGRQPVQVVGAGVIGLCCAIRLAEAGHAVGVIAGDLPGDTTSAVAGAVWMPYRAEPADLVAGWGRATLGELVRLASTDDGSGVLLREGVLLFREVPERPPWADSVEGFTELRTVRDPAPGYACGIALRVPILDVPRYLEQLVARLRRAGGQLVHQQLDALPQRGSSSMRRASPHVSSPVTPRCTRCAARPSCSTIPG